MPKQVVRCPSVMLLQLEDKSISFKPGPGQTEYEPSLLSPDTASCPTCRQELSNPDDRHYRYPFTSCSSCGPRFTIIQALPCDRPHTAMETFPLCPDCLREYRDPNGRRFNAQAAACPACGPEVTLVDCHGQPIARKNWLSMAARLLNKGQILAIKGLGGFHLACDASNPAAVTCLRRRKNRPAKSLAVICRDLETIKHYCLVSPAEAELLMSPAAPVVVLKRRAGCRLPPELAPGLDTLGVMLPYTPLHLLLLQAGPPLLVLTSGNRSHLPVVKDNHLALVELGDMADYLLLHNRNIINRCDDSVTTVVAGKTHLLRRSRGYVPLPIPVPLEPNAPVVLAVGAEIKNTFCLLVDGKAYLSPHMGEIDSREGQQNLEDSIEVFCRLLKVKPSLISSDLHPAYHSSRVADRLAQKYGARRHPGVQHHHAHLASCMAANETDEKVMGIILDGSGYGCDGRLWGFEIMQGDYQSFSREYFLAYVPLPGGEQAIRNPWLTAAAYLHTFLGERGYEIAKRFFPQHRQELAVAAKMLSARFNTPLASSCGRLFDAVAAMLGLCYHNTYEGQAAVMLANLAPWFPAHIPPAGFLPELQPYPFTLEGPEIQPTSILEQVIKDIELGIDAALITRRFHDTIIAIVVAAAQKIRQRTGLCRIALSGGTWLNRYLLGAASLLLEGCGFEVLLPHLLPAGDGGLALGQAMVAAKQDKNWQSACPAKIRG